MLKKDYTARKKEIKGIFEEEYGYPHEDIESLISELFDDKQYDLIVDFIFSKFVEPKSDFYSFEIAYSLNDQDRKNDAKIVYEYLLKNEPNNSAVLNNLSNICKESGDIDRAWEYIQIAYDSNPDDEIVERNHQSLATIIQEREEKDALFQSAISSIENENDWVIGKLSNFIANSRKDDNYKDGVIPIPKWKFKVLIGTDEQKAESLQNQWLNKGYLRKTGQRGQFSELIYEINPHVAGAIAKLKPKKINQDWVSALTNLDSEFLESHNYFEVKTKISKIKKSIRTNLERDIDELYINYLLKNSKSVVILSGSVVELLIIYHLEKKKITSIQYTLGKRTVNKKLYDSDLSDLLTFCETNNYLNNIIVHLGNISRLNRNYIHPGKELREKEPLDFMKANLCFAATLEILRAIT